MAIRYSSTPTPGERMIKAAKQAREKVSEMVEMAQKEPSPDYQQVAKAKVELAKSLISKDNAAPKKGRKPSGDAKDVLSLRLPPDLIARVKSLPDWKDEVEGALVAMCEAVEFELTRSIPS
jgi:hypothetical protein